MVKPIKQLKTSFHSEQIPEIPQERSDRSGIIWGEEAKLSLLGKFNSNIASLWSSDAESLKTFNSIWSYDSSFSSPRSSTSPSPKHDVIKKIWESKDEDPTLNGAHFGTSFWDPQTSTSTTAKKNLFWSPKKTNSRADTWFTLKRFDQKSDFNFNIGCSHNNTTLSNHGGDCSSFIEVPKKENSLEKLLDELSLPDWPTRTCTHAEEEEEATENLLLSPKTHFLPIKQDSLDIETDDGILTEPDDEVSCLIPCSTNCPNNGNKYAIDLTINLDEEKPRPISTSLAELASFIGPFGEEIVEIDVPDDDDDEEDDDEEEEEALNSSIHDESSSLKDKANSTEYEDNEIDCDSKNSNNIDFGNQFTDLISRISDVLDDPGKHKDENSSAQAVWDWFEEDKEVNNARVKGHRSSWAFYRDIFKSDSPNASKMHHLELMQKEIKQEEEEIFADIKYLSEQLIKEPDQQENPPYEGDDEVFNITDVSKGYFYENDCAPSLITNSEEFISPEWSSDSKYDSKYDYNAASGDYENLDSNQVYYSWDLEEEWQKEDLNTIQGEPRQRLDSGYYRRPCSFFLEGNCMRSDCKFSHDLANITCKFWEEGSCFKGNLCPFYHGYIKESQKCHKGYDSKAPGFTIESEADFPSLSTREMSFCSKEFENPIEDTECFKNKRDKKESHVLFRMVKKKRRKGNQQNYNEKAV